MHSSGRLRALPAILMVGMITPAWCGEGVAKRIKVLADKAPDCSSRKAIVESVTRGCKTNDEKAIAIYNFCKLAWYHRQYPNEPGGVAALKMINVYGWSLCGGQHSALSSLWVAAGWQHRFVGWPGHTTVEVNYDGRWHYFDTFLKFYCWMQDPNAPGGRTVAGQGDIASNPALVDDGLVYDEARKVCYHAGNQFEIIDDKANWAAPAFLVCGDGAKGVISGCKARHGSGSPTGWAGINHDENGYTTDIDLGPGMALEVMWKALPDCWYWRGQKEAPRHTCNDKDFRNCPVIGPIYEPYAGVYESRGSRSYANGVLTFAPDLSSDAFLSGLTAKENVKVAGGQLVPADSAKAATITLRLALPYVLVKASGQAEGVDGAEVSVDEGKTFTKVDLKDFSAAINGRYDCLLKLTVGKAMKSLKVEMIVQHNRGSQPYLSPGKNRISVSVADPAQLGDNRLCITYAYAPGERRVSYEELAEEGAGVARAHKASWPDTPTVVQKIFAAKDLPAEFEIDVPTPKDKYPVYPRMLFLRREVLAPGQKPMPLPEGAVEPKTGPDDELKTLPNPFLMGTTPAPVKRPRPTTMKELPLSCSHVLDFEGKTYDNHFIKTVPNRPDWWIMLIGGELGKLPEAGGISAARLCIPVTMSSPRANVKVGVLSLKAPFTKEEPFDANNFGDVLATIVAPKQAEPGPAKYFKFDLTRYLKALARGKEKFNGLALKVLPDRSVDDGWTVRIDVSKEEKTYVELDVYADEEESPREP